MLKTLDMQIVLSLFVSIFLVFEYFDTDIIGIKYSVSVHIKHTHFVIIQFMPINHKAITYSIIIALNANHRRNKRYHQFQRGIHNRSTL